MGGLVAGGGAVGVALLGFLLHVFQQLVVLDVVGIVVLHVAHRVVFNDVGPGLPAHRPFIIGEQHSEVGLGRVVPELIEHPAALRRVEVAEAAGHGQLADAAGQYDAALLVVKGAVDGIHHGLLAGHRVGHGGGGEAGRPAPGRRLKPAKAKKVAFFFM